MTPPVKEFQQRKPSKKVLGIFHIIKEEKYILRLSNSVNVF